MDTPYSFLHIFLEDSSSISCIFSMYFPFGVSLFIPSTVTNVIVDDCINVRHQKLKTKKKEKLCFYLHGKVGVGKTMLLNFVYDRSKIKKYRQHFNEFMINFHDFRHEKKDNNSIRAFVKKLKKKYDLIYLDEFQVSNIVDAMILGKLFEVIFEENITVSSFSINTSG